MPASECALGRTAPRRRLKLSAKGRWVSQSSAPHWTSPPSSCWGCAEENAGFRVTGDPALAWVPPAGQDMCSQQVGQ